MKNLQLSLKQKWFDMTKAGIKKEDYRELTPYWFKRLTYYQRREFKYFTDHDFSVMIEDILNSCQSSDYTDELDYQLDNWYITFKEFDENIMTLGYPKKDDPERTLRFEHSGIEIRMGNPEWGAEPNKLYFVIKHGKKL